MARCQGVQLVVDERHQPIERILAAILPLAQEPGDVRRAGSVGHRGETDLRQCTQVATGSKPAVSRFSAQRRVISQAVPGQCGHNGAGARGAQRAARATAGSVRAACDDDDGDAADDAQPASCGTRARESVHIVGRRTGGASREAITASDRCANASRSALTACGEDSTMRALSPLTPHVTRTATS